MKKGFWQNTKTPAFRSGFLAIGAVMIITSGVAIGSSSALSTSCGTSCIASNLALTFGGVMLFAALLNYTQSCNERWVGVSSIILSIILIAADYIGWAGSRPLLIGAVFALVGGIFSLIASRS